MIHSYRCSVCCFWSICTTNKIIPLATNKSFRPTKNGSYAVILYINGCSDTSSCKTILWTGISENPYEGLKVFPNPTNGQLNITGIQPQFHSIVIMDMLGTKVTSQKISTNVLKVNIHGSDGLYMLQFLGLNGEVLETRKVVKKE